MIRLALCFLLASLVGAGPADAKDRATSPASQIRFDGGSGETCDTAVVIKGARNSAAGMAAMKTWIARNHAGARRLGSAVTRKGERIFDIITVAKPDRPSMNICFDVTGFFGRW